MKLTKKSLLAIAVTALLSSACTEQPQASSTTDASKDSSSTPTTASKEVEDGLVRVNGATITPALYKVFLDLARTQGVPADASPEQQLALLNQLVNLMLITQDAEKRGLDKTAPVIAELQLLRIKALTEAGIKA
ncbi:MAG: hypothetical protein KZQ58_07750 [gamma proteobacterium symbiont of Bathyaustriella thionipta]|nr:hypothetical protein [gamma proteobacterium symbiont of Bathyaustriella thionipta]